MTRLKKAAAALGVTLALAMAFVTGARAATATSPAHEDLIVSFTAALSVKIDGVQYSTRTLGPRNFGETVVPSSATVTNDSAGLTEKFQLHTLDASPAAVTPLWTVAAATGSTGGGTFCGTNQAGAGCPGADQYGLQALFISSANTVGCPTATDPDWDVFKSTVAATPTTYIAGYFSNTSAGFGNNGGGTGNPDQTGGAQNGNMHSIFAGSDGRGRRGLCLRLTMPSASTTVSDHTVRLTITAITGS